MTGPLIQIKKHLPSGTIILHRLANVEGVTISAVSLQAPKDAKKAYDKGHDLLKKKKPAETAATMEIR